MPPQTDSFEEPTPTQQQVYPPMDMKPIPQSTSFVGELRPREAAKEDLAAQVRRFVRGDSYQGGLDQMDQMQSREDKLVRKDGDTELEKQLQIRLMMAAALSFQPPPHTFGPIVVVSSYTQFSDLAHGPRGTMATRSLRSYRLNITDGSLTLLSVTGEGEIHNPAFSRCHPKLNVIYACTESVKQEGQVVALSLDGKTGALRELCPPVGARGTSTCYLTIHHSCRRMLLVNYWVRARSLEPAAESGRRNPCGRQSVVLVAAAGLDDLHGAHGARRDAGRRDGDVRPEAGQEDEGERGPPREPLAQRRGGAGGAPGRPALARHRPRALQGHGARRTPALLRRRPHFRVLPSSHHVSPPMAAAAPQVAFVPDLGMDLIRQFHFDEETGVVTPCGEIVSGVKSDGRALGPRYMVFHQRLHICYVVNELSSQAPPPAPASPASARLRPPLHPPPPPPPPRTDPSSRRPALRRLLRRHPLLLGRHRWPSSSSTPRSPPRSTRSARARRPKRGPS